MQLLKKTGIIILSLILAVYLLFLLLPFILTKYVASYDKQIETVIKDSTGLEADIDGLYLITRPDLSVGIGIKSLNIKETVENKPFGKVSNAQMTLKLFPILFKNIQIGKISAQKIDINLTLNKNGEAVILEYIPESEEKSGIFSLPFGLKLSNKLPDINLGEYKLGVTDYNGKSYYAQGDKFKISDFVFNKKVKFNSRGKLILDGNTVSNYDIKISNKIMPDISFDDFVFKRQSPVEGASENKADIPFNIENILTSVLKNNPHVDINADIKTSGTFKKPVQNGYLYLDNISVSVNGKQLPQGYARLQFKGYKTDIDTLLYSSFDNSEQTQLKGVISSGNRKYINLTLKSNAKFNNLIRIVDSVAQTFGINDFKTISATGSMDADFKINSDYKSVSSDGYLKISPSTLKYGLYGINISDINADINLKDNNINIKNAGFSVSGNALNLSGTISKDAVADLKLNGNNLFIKDLLGALMQTAILKENDIKSGLLSLNVILKGKLNNIEPVVNLVLKNLNLYNKSAAANVSLDNLNSDIKINNSKFSGDINLNSLITKVNGAVVSVPKANISANQKDININNSYVMINNSKVDVTGAVKDYLSDKLNIDIKANGNLASSDIVVFIPSDVRNMFPYKGYMPVEIKVNGNAKTQDICFNLTATPNGYIQFADINLLKGKNTKIHTDLKIMGDTVKLENSGIYANDSRIAVFDGVINNLYSNPKLNLIINVPQNVSFPIPGMSQNSNITANGNVNILGDLDKPKVKGKVFLSDISDKGMDFVIKNVNANLDGSGISGNATADSFKFGGISASDLSGKFLLSDFTDFYLNDINAQAFSGKVSGKLTYNIPNFKFGLNFAGKGLNSTDAVYGATGIPKALTGTMNFSADLKGKGVTETEIINSLSGNIKFGVDDGRFVSIGRLENFVTAQNITSNSILKSAISALSTANAIQESDRFKTITGDMTMSNGSANISYINVSGPMMSYYIKGIYNIIPNTAKLVILGRLDSKVISYLGPLGQLSAEKLLSYIPAIGSATAKYLNLLTEDPKNEKTELIPPLSSGSEQYKDFKVIYNGSVGKPASVKSFKWLSKCDTSKINITQDLQGAQKAVKENIENRIQDTKTKIENTQKNIDKVIDYHKQNIETQKKSIEQAAQDIKNIKQNAGQGASGLAKMLLNAASNGNNKTQTPEQSPTQTESQSGDKTE